MMTSPLHFPGMTYLVGPYILDYTNIIHDGDTKVLWTPSIGDYIVSFLGFNGTDFLPGTNGLVQIGQNPLVNPWIATVSRFDFNVTALHVITSNSPVLAEYVANGDGDLTAGHIELYIVVARSPST